MNHLNTIHSLCIEVDATPIHEKISNYDTSCFWNYRQFHSSAGSIHLAIREDNRFSRLDYRTQVQQNRETICLARMYIHANITPDR